MEKLLFLVPDVDAAKQSVEKLHDLGIHDEHIGIIGNDQQPIDELPQPDVTDKSDVVPAFARGVVTGGGVGLFAGLAAMAFPPAGIVVGGGAVATAALGGASFGAFASSLIGTSVENSQLREFEDELESGKLLLIVTAEEARHDDIQAALSNDCQRAEIRGEKDPIPPAV